MNGGKTAVHQQPNQLFLQNKASLDLSEDNLDAHYGDNSLIVMKNDFYNDDFYDYKDTFLGKLDQKGPYTDKVAPNSNSNGKVVKIVTGEDYDDDLGDRTDEEDNDSGNFFETGPLAAKKATAAVDKESEEDFSGYDNNNEDNNFSDNGVQFNVHQEDDEDIDYTKMQAGDRFIADDYDNQEELLRCDPFFKRVDSMELCKPKKAKIVNNYLMGELLGDGSYGKVKECIDLETLSRRAVKIINLKIIARKIPRGVENVRKEINIMKRLNHSNVIKLYDTYEKAGQTLQQEQHNMDPRQQDTRDMDELLAITSTMVNIEKPPKLYIFMDYCMTSLEKLLKTAPDQRLRNWQANHYFKQLIDGLEYLHSLNIIHNDIKPGNLLITCDDTLKICDFSISAELNIFYEHEYLKSKENETTDDNEDREYDPAIDGDVNPQLIGNNRNSSGSNRSRFPIIQCTPMFQCPEMLDENIDELLVLKNAPKIDIWSTGITLYQLTTGQLPFQGQTIHQIFENIRSDSYVIKIPDDLSKNLRELLVNMLNRDPLKRWSLKQIRDCEWFRKKHPFVHEDLANLPDDVVQNEFATFRMINYLEKLCQMKTINELTSNDFSQFYDDIANQPNAEQSQFANLNINNDNINPVCNNINIPVAGGAPAPISNKTNMPKEYSQATKVKKSHCSLM